MSWLSRGTHCRSVGINIDAAMNTTTDDGNQQRRGLRGDPIANRTTGADTRDKAFHAQHSRTYRDRHRALGLCLECPHPAMTDRTRCRPCLIKRSACALRRRARITAQKMKAA